MNWTPDGEDCHGCAAPLAKGDAFGECDRCHRERRETLRTPPTHLTNRFFDTDHFRAAFDAHHMGHVIKAYRTHQRWLRLHGRVLKQEIVGNWLGLNQAQVSRMENGRAEKNLDTLRFYARILHIPRHVLWFLFPGESRLIRPAPMTEFGEGQLERVGDGAPCVDLVGVDPSSVLEAHSAFDITALNDARNHFEVMYRNLGGSLTRERLARFLSVLVTPLIVPPASQKDSQRLYRATGGLTALLGVCAYDSESHGAARRHFQDALVLADRAGDPEFRAYVLALMVNQALALGDARRAIDVAEAALRASSELPCALQADLHGMQAKAYALLKDPGATYRSMSLAERSAAGIGVRVGPAEIGYIQEGLTEAHFVDALTELGDLVPARRYSERIVDVPTHARGRVNRLASLATLELRLGDVERASSVIMEMVDGARGMESRRLNARFRAIRSSLDKADSAGTSDAVERIDRFMMISPW